MITLTTLHEATAQEVFDQVATHLLTQGVRSTHVVKTHGVHGIRKRTRCAYRGEKGLMCAAGCLISDSEYSSDFEGKSWGRLMMVTGRTKTDHLGLIGLLQGIHDQHLPEEWKTKLIEVGGYQGLDVSKVINFKKTWEK